MSDFNSDDIQKLSENLAAMNRSLIALNRSFSQNRKTAGKTATPRPESSPPKGGTAPGNRDSQSSDGVMRTANSVKKDVSGAASEFSSKSKSMVKNMADSTSTMAKSMGRLDNEFGTIGRTLNAFKGVMSIAAVSTYVVDVLKDTITGYRSMIDAGQSFGGSMMQMQMAAANARMPLEDLISVVSKYSNAMAITGVKTFGDMNKSLRDGLSNFGLLGFQTQEINEFMGEYLETQRMSGILSRASSVETVHLMKTMAMDATRVSELTGTSRKEIMKATMEAMREASVRSRMMMMTGDAALQMQKGMGVAATYFAGIPGEGGKLLNNMFSQTLGKGSSLLSEEVRSFSQVGMGGIASLMDDLSAKAKSGTIDMSDMETFRDRLLSMGEAQMASLKYMADVGDNADAQKVLDLVASFQSMSKQQMRELAQQQKATTFFLNLQNTLQTFTAFFKEKFYTAFSQVFGEVEDFSESESFKALQDKIGQFATFMGKWFADALTPENIDKFSTNLTDILEGFAKVGSMAFATAEWIGKYIVPGVELMGTMIVKLSEFLSAFDEFTPLVIAAGALMFMKVKAMVAEFYKAFKSALFSKPAMTDSKGMTRPGPMGPQAKVSGGAMHVKVVNQNGGGGGFDRNGRGSRKGGRKGGRNNRRTGGGRDSDNKSGPTSKRNDLPNKTTDAGNKQPNKQPSKQDTSKPNTSKPNISKPDISKPDSGKPDANKPNTGKTDAGKPTVDPKGNTTKQAPKPNKTIATPDLDAKKVSKISSLGSKAGSVVKAGVRGIGAGAVIGAATDYVRDNTEFAGKETVGVMGDIASYAAMGSMLGPWGTLGGAVIGGGMSLYNNWDAVKSEVGGWVGGSKKQAIQTPTVEVNELSKDEQSGMGGNRDIVEKMNENIQSNREVVNALNKVGGAIEKGNNDQVAGFTDVVKSTEQGKQVPSGAEWYGD